MSYKEGKASYVDYCNAKRISMHEINAMLKELDYEDETMIFYYLKPSFDLKNYLVELNNDKNNLCYV